MGSCAKGGWPHWYFDFAAMPMGCNSYQYYPYIAEDGQDCYADRKFSFINQASYVTAMRTWGLDESDTGTLWGGIGNVRCMLD